MAADAADRERAVRAAFRRQAEVCHDMGSPFTARLCRLLADRLRPDGPVARRVLAWPGDPSNRADALPLRLAGALHALVLEERDPRLADAYPPDPADDEALWRSVAAALADHAPFLLSRLDGPPQTNEPQRTAGLVPGLLTVAAATRLPLVCSEIGASAGLNLLWDRFAYRFGDARWGDAASRVVVEPRWEGPPPPLPAAEVAERAGCDLQPIDPADPDDATRLLSYVWADQLDRLARTGAALALARDVGVRVEKAEAGDWLTGRLAEPRPGRVHVVLHSIVWQYLPDATRARIETLLGGAGARASDEAPLAWLRMEPDGASPGAALTLTLWPDGRTQRLGRVDFHGRWVTWGG
jgi:hypothetical protein